LTLYADLLISQGEHNDSSSCGDSDSTFPNMALISDLWDAIERNPPAIQARALLMDQWINAGWLGIAGDTARELLRFDPLNAAAQEFIRKNGAAKTNQSSTGIPEEKSANASTPRQHAAPKMLALPRRPEDRTAMELELSQGYEELRARAQTLLREYRLVSDLQGGNPQQPCTENRHIIQDLGALTDGCMSAVVSAVPPRSARAVSKAIEADQEQALDLAIGDLVEVARWVRSSSEKIIDNDTMREILAKRVRVMIAALPDGFQQLPQDALMHVEHEELGRTYVNSETMISLEDVGGIPRTNFWMSEDGYAWDMEELATAINSNGGVMRNPLSKQMFTQDDVRAIVEHPLGKRLAPLQVEQSELRRGVRMATIVRLDKLAAALLDDDNDDQIKSRHALDSFLAYVAMLPQVERKAIDVLRVPAKDSHTGQPFDCTIGEAVRDAQASKICLHKTGDLIGQAARHLRQSNSSGLG
jgi:hypothetical protein